MKMQLSEIAHAVNAQNDTKDWATLEITDVTFDSRKAKPGSLFVPLIADHDGHDYVQSAFDNGAVATLWAKGHLNMPNDVPVLVVQDPLQALQELGTYYLNKINPVVVAVTGSNGKTTTKDMIAAILGTQFNVTKTFQNYNNNIGVPLTLIEMEPNTEMLVVELGMDHPGDLDFLSQMVKPDIAVITMIGEAHIEFFGSRDKIADAKMEITNGLKSDGWLVYNGDEPLLNERTINLNQRLQKFGEQLQNDLYVTAVSVSATATTFMTNEWPMTEFMVPMIGEYNVNNALAALSVGKILQIQLENMRQALAKLQVSDNRTEWVKGAHGEKILSDVYNSNPTAAKEVLQAFTNIPKSHQKIIVLGDMLELGQQANAFHASLASEISPAEIDQVFLIGSHMLALAKELKSKFNNQRLHWYDADSQEAMINDILKTIVPDDQILLKASHGMHLENVVQVLIKGR